MCQAGRRWCPHAAYVAFAALAAPSIRSRFCTAAPDAPLPRLSNTADSSTAVIRIDEHAEPQVIRAVQRLRIEMRDRVCFRERRDVDVTRVGVMVRKTRMQLLTGHAGRKQAQLDRHGEHDALPIGTVGRHEHRAIRQTGMQLDLRHMLVRECEAVDLKRFRVRSIVRLECVDGGPAAARVPETAWMLTG